MNTQYESDKETFTSETYTVKGWRGIAFYVLGWEVECEYTEDGDETGYKNRTGRVIVVMVGDDRKHFVDAEDLTPLAEGESCRECGQVGCTADGRSE